MIIYYWKEFVRTASDGNFDKCEYILKQFLIDVRYSGAFLIIRIRIKYN